MKKYFNLVVIFIAILSTCQLASAKSSDYEIVNDVIEKCSQIGTSECYKDALHTYKYNEIRYLYAYALLKEKKYSQAKNEFVYITNNEKRNTKLIELSQKGIERIEKRYDDMRIAENNDWGDYYEELGSTSKWKYGKEIRVYIKGNTGKEYIFTNAFSIWDDAISSINFLYVDSEEKADIICYYVDNLSGNRAGVTESKGYTDEYGNNYLLQAQIKIAQLNAQNTRQMSDKELLSVILHEIGHSLGIQGHSKNQNDVMYHNTDTYQTTNISRRDVNTVKKIYEEL